MKAIVYSKQGKKKSEVVLNPAIFAARVNERLLELVRNAYSANKRRGTAATKARKYVRGGGKKPWRQKGTGRARAGSSRSPIWRGGGTIFVPHPRSYYVALPKTMRKQSLISALSLRGSQKSLFLLEDVKINSAKTKDWAEVVKALPLDGKRALCVVRDLNPEFERATRNLSRTVEIQRARDLNSFDVLQKTKLIIEQDALETIEARLLGGQVGKEASSKEEGGEVKPLAKKKSKVKAGKSRKVVKARKPTAKTADKKKAAPKKKTGKKS